MSTVLLLYKDITALSREEHRNLKLKSKTSMAFAAHTHWLPLACAEFYLAARSHPIVFISEGEPGREQIIPIAVLGLEAGRNEYVSKHGQWKHNTYIPAFVRRYPFVLADTAERQGDFTICFDATFPGLNEKEGKALFNDDGSNSELLDEFARFMGVFDKEMEQTQNFVASLREFDLLEKRGANIRSTSGASFQLQDFLVVSEEKFARLTGAQVATLHKKGYLGWIFAHQMSLANLSALLDLHMINKLVNKTAH